MVSLDQDLVARAYVCIRDRESSHRVRELIYAYQLAVDYHNRQVGSHVEYEPRYETDLRNFVIEDERKRRELA
jgi:hypothetical protein